MIKYENIRDLVTKSMLDPFKRTESAAEASTTSPLSRCTPHLLCCDLKCPFEPTILINVKETHLGGKVSAS